MQLNGDSKRFDPLGLVRLNSVMEMTEGDDQVTIGVIDGPVDSDHPALRQGQFRTVKDLPNLICNNINCQATEHGTTTAGILWGERKKLVPGICPGCSVILYPLFKDSGKRNKIALEITTDDLSNAIIDTIDAGADIINLGLGIMHSSIHTHRLLRDAFDLATRKKVIMVCAAGNQGIIGNILVKHSWAIHVAASDLSGNLASFSNFGSYIGSRGLMAPGVSIKSTSPGGGFMISSGTSVATPFVTGTIALLMSIFKKAKPQQIINALICGPQSNRPSIVPPLLNAQCAFEKLTRSR